MTDAPLTPEQQKLAEDNHKLIYWFMKRHGLYDDEYYGIFAISLCKAAREYDESKGAFSTVATKYMSSDLQKYWEHLSLKKAVPQSAIMSLSTPLPGSYTNGTMEEVIDDEGTVVTMDITRPDVERFIQGLKPKYKTVILYLMYGYDSMHTAKRLGCTRSRINQIKKAVGEQWMNFERSYI